MKSPFLLSALAALGIIATGFAQKTTVTATSYDISDNLDLRAVASIFGDSRDLADFEYRLNNPEYQISNLDLNADRQVDYLRVLEAIEGPTRLVIIQAVLDRDVYQDVATIEAERRGKSVTVQIVGNAYMYGPNYIYEPAFVHVPVFYSHWWSIGYHPYHSPWYWGSYPTYFRPWSPFPVFAYRSHIHHHINVHHHYHYVNVRRTPRAVAIHQTHRANAYETRYPNRSFQHRNTSVTNHYELNQRRPTSALPVAGRNSAVAPRTTNNATPVRNNAVQNTSGRNQNHVSVRGNSVATSARNATTTSRSQNVQSVQSTPSRSASANTTRPTASSPASTRNINSATPPVNNTVQRQITPRSETTLPSVRSTPNRSAAPARENTSSTSRTAARSTPATSSRVSAPARASSSASSQIAPRSSQRQAPALQRTRN